jgi:hypothetical protein
MIGTVLFVVVSAVGVGALVVWVVDRRRHRGSRRW